MFVKHNPTLKLLSLQLSCHCHKDPLSLLEQISNSSSPKFFQKNLTSLLFYIKLKLVYGGRGFFYLLRRNTPSNITNIWHCHSVFKVQAISLANKEIDTGFIFFTLFEYKAWIWPLPSKILLQQTFSKVGFPNLSLLKLLWVNHLSLFSVPFKTTFVWQICDLQCLKVVCNHKPSFPSWLWVTWVVVTSNV